MDKREYLRFHGFAVGERGRFSADMQAALDAAPPGSFSDTPKPVKPKVDAPVGTYDPKVVRRWAVAQGLVESGKRGRLPASVLAAFDALDTKPVSERRVAPTPAEVMPVREQTVAYFFARRRPQDGSHITEPLVETGACAKAHPIRFCKCSPPMSPVWAGSEPLLLSRPQ